MNEFFEKSYQLRANDFDLYGRILPSSILDLFQSAASEHAFLLDVGFDKLSENNLAWVLTKVKFEIISMPEKYSELKVKTWPLKNGRVTFEREYIIYDKNANILIKGSSEWVVIDTLKRKIASVSNLYNLSEEEFLTEKNFEGKFLKVPPFEPESKEVALHPSYTDFDANGHVNNTKYADFIINVNPPKPHQTLRKMQIDYHLEIKDDSPVMIQYKEWGNEIFIIGKNVEGQLNFSAKYEINISQPQIH